MKILKKLNQKPCFQHKFIEMSGIRTCIYVPYNKVFSEYSCFIKLKTDHFSSSLISISIRTLMIEFVYSSYCDLNNTYQ